MATKTFTQFRVDNVVTTLPTTLSYGQEVYYKDANGNLTLWVGHEDGTAWPAVGYKEIVYKTLVDSEPIKSDISSVSKSYTTEIVINVPSQTSATRFSLIGGTGRIEGPGTMIMIMIGTASFDNGGNLTLTVRDLSGAQVTSSLSSVNAPLTIRIYP